MDASFFPLLVIFSLVVVLKAAIGGKGRRRRRSGPKRREPRRGSDRPEAVADEASHRPVAPEVATSENPRSGLDKLQACQVRVVPIMGREQARLLDRLRPWANENDFLLAPEVSLSAIFRVSHRRDSKLAYAAFATIRQKYVDILLTDRDHRPVCGIEYHGDGHWQKDAEKRDALKRAAFECAGLPFLEVRPGDSYDLVRDRLIMMLGLDASPADPGMSLDERGPVTPADRSEPWKATPASPPIS